MITDQQIKQGLDKAYKEAGHNAFFGNGFEAGVKFALEQVKNIAVVKSRFSDVEITDKAIEYAKEFEIRDKPIETAKIQGYAVRDYYAGYKAALNGA